MALMICVQLLGGEGESRRLCEQAHLNESSLCWLPLVIHFTHVRRVLRTQATNQDSYKHHVELGAGEIELKPCALNWRRA